MLPALGGTRADAGAPTRLGAAGARALAAMVLSLGRRPSRGRGRARFGTQGGDHCAPGAPHTHPPLTGVHRRTRAGALAALTHRPNSLPPSCRPLPCARQSERDGARASLADVQQQLSALQQRHAQQTMQLEAQLREQAAAAAEERLRERGELKAQMERWVPCCGAPRGGGCCPVARGRAAVESGGARLCCCSCARPGRRPDHGGAGPAVGPALARRRRSTSNPEHPPRSPAVRRTQRRARPPPPPVPRSPLSPPPQGGGGRGAPRHRGGGGAGGAAV